MLSMAKRPCKVGERMVCWTEVWAYYSALRVDGMMEEKVAL